VPVDPPTVPGGRAAGAALLLASLLLLSLFAVVLVVDRGVLPGLLILFGVVSVPALIAALVGVGVGATAARTGALPRTAAFCGAALALGFLGVVALSLRPGVDGRLDGGDLAGAAVGAAGALASLGVLAVALPWRTLPVRLVAALGAGVLALALLVLRAVSQLD
jgi:hypothetical protein